MQLDVILTLGDMHSGGLISENGRGALEPPDADEKAQAGYFNVLEHCKTPGVLQRVLR